MRRNTLRYCALRGLSEEQAAGKSVYSLEQQPHIDAANRLRALLENEHKKYREAISELHSLQKPK
jgi:hypothetical protein